MRGCPGMGPQKAVHLVAETGKEIPAVSIGLRTSVGEPSGMSDSLGAAWGRRRWLSETA